MNKAQWTQDLHEALEHKRRQGTKVPSSIINRYNQEDVRQALKSMYGGLCCYCESSITEVTYAHIEHRKPKASFPELAFEWTNLHLACPRCNQAKSDRYDPDNPILDATKPESIDDHLTYAEPEEAEEGVACKAVTLRGQTTIRHTDLNRKPLCTARLDVYLKTAKLAFLIRRKPNHPNTPLVKQQIFNKCSRRHGSLIRWPGNRKPPTTPVPLI